MPPRQSTHRPRRSVGVGLHQRCRPACRQPVVDKAVTGGILARHRGGTRRRHRAGRGQLLAFRANQLVLAARPADVVAMIDTVDYGTLDGYGQSVRLAPKPWRSARSGAPVKPWPRPNPATRYSTHLSRATSSVRHSSSSIRSRSRSPVASKRRSRCPNATATTVPQVLRRHGRWRRRSPGWSRCRRATCVRHCSSCLPTVRPTTPTWCSPTASTGSICSALRPWPEPAMSMPPRRRCGWPRPTGTPPICWWN